MSYKSDNLSPKQKKNALIGIFFLSALFVVVFIYKSRKTTEREKLLAYNTKTTVCKIVQTSSYKGVTNTVEYKVNEKKYKYETGWSGREFKIGELYTLKYSLKKPEISKVLFDRPVITNIEQYKEARGIVVSLYTNSRVNIVKFNYSYEEVNYVREVYVNDISKYKEGVEYPILVNKKTPRISYLKSTIEILN